jgi:hypothetical protein
VLFAIATLILLFAMGWRELDIKEITGVVAFLICVGLVIVLSNLSAVLVVVAVALADIYLILRIFGTDITV